MFIKSKLNTTDSCYNFEIFWGYIPVFLAAAVLKSLYLMWLKLRQVHFYLVFLLY